MTLSLGFQSPHDVLGKAKRDLVDLNQAIAGQDHGRISDALYNFSVSISSVKDWLKAHPSQSYVNTDAETFVSGSKALSAFRDLANANKHRIITRYTPVTNEVTVSVMPYTRLGGSSVVGRRQRFRVKIVGADGSRFEAGALAQEAVNEWQKFMARHGV